MHSDQDFQLACTELDTADVEGWEFFTESHDVKIYRLYNEESGLYQYKIYGFMRDVAPDVCAQVYMDTEYRKQWDSYCKELYTIGEGKDQLIYWNINYPFPMSNRDYVYQRELREINCEDNHVWVILADSSSHPDIPEVSGVVRVDDYHQVAALRSDGKSGTQAYMRYYDNPKGMIPTWLINWAARSGVPSFLGTMQKACIGYSKYLNNK